MSFATSRPTVGLCTQGGGLQEAFEAFVASSECDVVVASDRDATLESLGKPLPQALVLDCTDDHRLRQSQYDAYTRRLDRSDAPVLVVCNRRSERKARRLLRRDTDRLIQMPPIDGPTLAQIVRELLTLPQRRSSRLPVELMVRFYPTDEAGQNVNGSIRARTCNISGGGMLAKAYESFEAGARLRIVLNFPETRNPLELLGVIRRVDRINGHSAYGIQFQDHVEGDASVFERHLGIPLQIRPVR